MKRGAFFEDLRQGERHETTGVSVTEDAIIRFGSEWDPQPFHLDAEAARASIFGSLIASGLHTLLLSYRMFQNLGLLHGTGLAGLGYKDIQFLKPVRPGDTLRVAVTVEDLRHSRRPDGGIASIRLETFNQDQVRVLTSLVEILVARRNPGPGA